MNPFLGSDIIAGFVGETVEDFSVTVENLKKSGLSKIHTFPYSIRTGTIAESMDGHLPDEIKQQRAEIIKEISRDKFSNFMQKNLESVQEVLIEKRPDKRTGFIKGVTKNYLNVVVPNILDNKYLNTLQQVRLSNINGEKFEGILQ